MNSFRPVLLHRLRYLMTPQLDLYANIERLFVRHLPLNSTIADYGCGTGQGTVRLINRHVISAFGFDSDPEVVDFARDVFGNLAHFVDSDWIEQPPNPDIKFDLITCVEVIEHVHNPKKLLSVIRDLSAPNGTIVLSTQNTFSDYRKNNSHTGRFDALSFREMLEEYFPGVRIVDWTLVNKVPDDSGRTPIVGIWHNKESKK